MGKIAIVGAGFVADYYMRSAALFPDHRFTGVWDEDPERLVKFSSHWNVPAARGLDDLFQGPKRPHLLLNLTNPRDHAAINRRALEAGIPVYCEKPLATDIEDARSLVELSVEKGVPIASAPCSVLGQSAQTMWWALRRRMIGKPHLIYAELDDGYVPQAPYQSWVSETGAPWPARDEFEVGCTLEHAGYYLTWLMAMFGPVRTVVAGSATLIEDKLGDGGPTAPDWSTAMLFFDDNVVARLTCSILGRHDHRIRIIGERGTLTVEAAWNNAAPVRIDRRSAVRRRLIDGLVRERVKLARPPYARRWSRLPMAMNFMLGPDEMLRAIEQAEAPRLAGDFALHLTEVTLAIQNSGQDAGAQAIQSTFEPMAPMPWARPFRWRRSSNVEAIKLGIVGTGPMASVMRDAIRNEPRLDVLAVASRTEARAREFASLNEIERAYGELDALLNSDVEAVYIGNETARHAETAIACLKAGKAVLCEKPFATSPEEAEQVLAAAREAGVLFMEALWTPLLPAHRRAVDLARGGTLGEPLHLSMDFGYPANPESNPRLFEPDGGGVILDRMIYPLGLALSLFGDVEDLESFVTWQDGIDVQASLQLRHKGGGVSQLSASLVTLMANTARIACTGGSVRIEEPVVGAEQLSIKRMTAPAAVATERVLTAPKPGVSARTQLTSRLRRSGVMRRVNRVVSAPRQETHGYGANQYAPLLAHFATLVRDQALESDVVTHERSMTIQRLLAEARAGGPPLAARRRLPAPDPTEPEPAAAIALAAEPGAASFIEPMFEHEALDHAREPEPVDRATESRPRGPDEADSPRASD